MGKVKFRLNWRDTALLKANNKKCRGGLPGNHTTLPFALDRGLSGTATREAMMYAQGVLFGTAIVLLLAGETTVAHAQKAAGPVTDAEMIASAMAAAPKGVAEGAAIVAMDSDGGMRTLREGTNGFTCMPDNPATPGPDPMCLDQNAFEWAHAWMGHQPPPDKVGFVYMLAGGSDASNTDPDAKGPEAGNHWISTGPHVMVVGPAVKMMVGYPRSADPDTSKPYVMWAGTPYEHLMIPMK